MKPLGSFLVFAMIAACSAGVPANLGLGEPMHIRDAQFISGTLPGRAPTTGVAGDSDAGTASALTLTDFSAQNSTVLLGQAGKKFSGRAVNGAVAVGLALVGDASGYWVIPMIDPDPQFPGEIPFEVSADFLPFETGGPRLLRAVALDANGAAGEQRELKLCTQGRTPDNLHACDATRDLPAAVFSLRWDADVDLDLVVTTPTGRVVDPRHPLVVPVESGRPPADAAMLDRDSLGSCVADGLRQENLVFPVLPTGTFRIGIRFNDACRQAGTRYSLTVQQRVGSGAEQSFTETFHAESSFSAQDVTIGDGPGVAIVAYPFGN